MAMLAEIELAIRQLPPADVDHLRIWLNALGTEPESRLDRVSFSFDPDGWEAFCARLDAPPAANDGLRRLLETPPLWAR